MIDNGLKTVSLEQSKQFGIHQAVMNIGPGLVERVA